MRTRHPGAIRRSAPNRWFDWSGEGLPPAFGWWVAPRCENDGWDIVRIQLPFTSAGVVYIFSSLKAALHWRAVLRGTARRP